MGFSSCDECQEFACFYIAQDVLIKSSQLKQTLPMDYALVHCRPTWSILDVDQLDLPALVLSINFSSFFRMSSNNSPLVHSHGGSLCTLDLECKVQRARDFYCASKKTTLSQEAGIFWCWPLRMLLLELRVGRYYLYLWQSISWCFGMLFFVRLSFFSRYYLWFLRILYH